MTNKYLFTSERLGFRNWAETDIDPMSALCADPEVMEFFSPITDIDYTANFIKRMQKQYAESEYCFFAVDKMDTNEFIGFIGLSDITYPADFTPSVEIGWRLQKKEWNKGYATEGAKRCLQYAFEDLKIPIIHSIAPEINKKSQRIMIKIGMSRIGSFDHPLLLNDPRLKSCTIYKIEV